MAQPCRPDLECGGKGRTRTVGVAARAGAVPVRDSKDRSGPQLAFTPDARSAFVADVRVTGANTP
ncbi:DUF397 domain-containing protein [Streptomyces meridianus]|uniref:DUF397 domain-containing protein n=1 Tax=Streptomyces meridianus TaxID=2938945 RepID=A0ABT0X913_9ACTN|nr:DUF397 domain-containing protein [Streptomyces meridianus]MCM2579028.1 DUF397 domain-containing protein [Streptomyces meridianus]